MEKERSALKTLKLGITAHRAGKIKLAEKYYMESLKLQPDHPDANHNMGVLKVGLGKLEKAIFFFEAALKSNPAIEQFWISYLDSLIKLGNLSGYDKALEEAKKNGISGENLKRIKQKVIKGHEKIWQSNASLQNEIVNLVALYKLGEFEQVLEDAQLLIKKAPGYFVLHNIIGAAYNGLGFHDDALVAYKHAILIKPDYAEALINIGNVLHKKTKFSEALFYYSKALEITPTFAQVFNNIGNVLQDQGKLEDAITSYRKAISINPNYAEAYSNMGNALHKKKKFSSALSCYSKALEITPTFAQVFNNIGNVLQDQGKLEDAIASYRKAISINPDYAEAYSNMGNVARENGKHENALLFHKKAIAINPDYAEAYNNMATVLQDQGKTDEAKSSYEKALSIKSDHAEANRNLSIIKKYDKNDKQFATVINLLLNKELSEEDRCSLSFTITKMYEDIGQFESAFRYLKQGNRLRKKLLKYSFEQDEKIFLAMKKSQSDIMLSSLGKLTISKEKKPIFIVGMPRSGTTLVEQIISSHSKVYAAGELKYISRFGSPLATGSIEPDNETISGFRERYLSELLKYGSEENFITDKLPQNFLFIPLICAALPEAKIIHVRRDAAATCWSNYRQYFSSHGLGYSYDLKDVIRYYKHYYHLMTFWNTIYGDRLYNINYEDLSTNPQPIIRDLINYLDLEWEHACLTPQKNKRSVSTASSMQIRKKIYSGSSLKWKKYEPYLCGVFDVLPNR